MLILKLTLFHDLILAQNNSQLSKLSQVSGLLREIWYPGSVPDLQTICSWFWVTPPSNSYWFFLFSETKMTLVSIHQNDASPPWEACRQKRNETNVTVRPSRYRQPWVGWKSFGRSIRGMYFFLLGVFLHSIFCKEVRMTHLHPEKGVVKNEMNVTVCPSRY